MTVAARNICARAAIVAQWSRRAGPSAENMSAPLWCTLLAVGTNAPTPGAAMELPRSISEAHATRTPSLADKLATIRQMLATLDTLTIAGRRHLMAKVLAFVDGQVQRSAIIRAPGTAPCCWSNSRS
jgi:hypothetical protein